MTKNNEYEYPEWFEELLSLCEYNHNEPVQFALFDELQEEVEELTQTNVSTSYFHTSIIRIFMAANIYIRARSIREELKDRHWKKINKLMAETLNNELGGKEHHVLRYKKHNRPAWW